MRFIVSFAAASLLTALQAGDARSDPGSMRSFDERMLQSVQDVMVSGWNVLACTFDRPEFLSGTVVAVYFREAPAPRVHYRGAELDAFINVAEIRFSNGTVNWTISRITGGFSLDLKDSTASGNCVKGTPPKF